MLDVMQRCSDHINHSLPIWLYYSNGQYLPNFPKWIKIGPHEIKLFDSLNSINNLSNDFKIAVLHYLSNKANFIIGFHGSQLMESLSYINNKPLYFVFHRLAYCGEMVIRIPKISNWNLIMNQKSLNLNLFYTADFNNQYKDKV